MNITIGYPPTTSTKGLALLSQNRQFQWFSNPTKIYPVILATAATWARDKGHAVRWLDCIAADIPMDAFLKELESRPPDLYVFETKTPVVKQHWALIADLKARFPRMKIAVLGDHVTALPEETMEKCPVDFILCGGHFDFALIRLLEFLEKGGAVPDGIFHRAPTGYAGNAGFCPREKLEDAPVPDRDLTHWRLYQQEYNLQGKPFAYIMSGRDCWHGKCTFCSWTTLYPKFGVRPVPHVLDEIQMLVEKYGVKEIFDDSGTLNTGPWLADLCHGLMERGLHRKIRYSCNMRFGALKLEQYQLMRQAGFRLLKFGLESANQATLDRLVKGIRVEDIEEGCRLAKKAGLTVHLTMIIGYPWETSEDALRTFHLAEGLMKKGHADLLQATTIVPYPGTPLYKEALQNDGFLFDPREYERYDMGEPVLKTPMRPEEIRDICNRIYTIFLTPQYIWQRIKSIRHPRDLAFLARGAGAVLGHLKDFGQRR